MKKWIIQESKILLPGIFWIIIYLASLQLLKNDYNIILKIIITLIPLLPFTWFIMVVIRQMKKCDELKRKMYLESTAIGFVLSIIFFMTLSLLEKVTPLVHPHWGYSDVWYFMPFFYFVGLAINRLRYR